LSTYGVKDPWVSKNLGFINVRFVLIILFPEGYPRVGYTLSAGVRTLSYTRYVYMYCIYLKTMSSLDLSSSYCSSDVGVLDEPESAKHAQRSCRSGHGSSLCRLYAELA
jgi:hypothetical protein